MYQPCRHRAQVESTIESVCGFVQMSPRVAAVAKHVVAHRIRPLDVHEWHIRPTRPVRAIHHTTTSRSRHRVLTVGAGEHIRFWGQAACTPVADCGVVERAYRLDHGVSGMPQGLVGFRYDHQCAFVLRTASGLFVFALITKLSIVDLHDTVRRRHLILRVNVRNCLVCGQRVGREQSDTQLCRSPMATAAWSAHPPRQPIVSKPRKAADAAVPNTAKAVRHERTPTPRLCSIVYRELRHRNAPLELLHTQLIAITNLLKLHAQSRGGEY